MKTKNVEIPSNDYKLSLSTLVFEPSVKPKGIIQIEHGMAEHKERYVDLMEYLCTNGYICVINDHRGHGATSEEKDWGYFSDNGDGSAIVNDAVAVTKWIRNTYGDKLQLFMFGHSMGALISRVYLQENDMRLSAMILSGAPCRNGAVKMAKLLAALIGFFKGEHYRSNMLQGMAVGAYNKSFAKEGVENAWLTVSKENVVKYNSDKGCGFTFTINGFKNLFNLLENCFKKSAYHVRNPKLPILFMAGSKDPCIGGEDKFIEEVNFLRDIGYKNVDRKLYDGLRHETFNESDHKQVFFDIYSYFEKHTRKFYERTDDQQE